MKKDGKDPRFRFQLGRALFKMAMLVPEFGPKVRGGAPVTVTHHALGRSRGRAGWGGEYLIRQRKESADALGGPAPKGEGVGPRHRILADAGQCMGAGPPPGRLSLGGLRVP